MSSFCPRSVVGRPSARRIVGFGGRGGTISFTASDSRQVISRARLAGAQTALEHEQEEGPVTQPREGAEERRYLLVSERPRQALCGAHADGAPDRTLSGREVEEGDVPRRHARGGEVWNLPQNDEAAGCATTSSSRRGVLAR